MSFDQLLTAGNISASGMAAERRRMELIANNIANAYSTRSNGGNGPYRRREIVFESVMNAEAMSMGQASASTGLGGVRIANEIDDPSPLPTVYNPGHPDADNNGLVTMPNVAIPIEMVNLMTASRAYEANLKVLQSLRQQLETTLTLLRY
jgi:flagellar basal-body rod protein FlgC